MLLYRPTLEKREYRYDVTFFDGRMTKFIIKKCVVFCACDKMTVQRLFICLLAAAHLVQHVNLLILI